MTWRINNRNIRQSRYAHSPFRYVGGKFWLRNAILPLIPPHECYIEPFAGGASVFFLQETARRSHLNDLDEELINCYTQMRDHVDKLTARLSSLAINPETHQRLKTGPAPADALDRAARYWFLDQTSYAGITVAHTCYWLSRAPKFSTLTAWARKLRRASEMLDTVCLTCHDFETIIDAAPDGAFLFVDPPYRSARHYKFYAHVFTYADHVRLASCLRRHQNRLRFLLTYDDCTQVRELYDWSPQVQTIDRPNHFHSSYGQTVSGRVPALHAVGRELLIHNYEGPSRQWAILRSWSGFRALTDEHWHVVAPLLPLLPRREDKRGRPWREGRQVLDGILWVLVRAVPWYTLPGDYPPYQTCHRRYHQWKKDGTLPAVLRVLAEEGGPDLLGETADGELEASV